MNSYRKHFTMITLALCIFALPNFAFGQQSGCLQLKEVRAPKAVHKFDSVKIRVKFVAESCMVVVAQGYESVPESSVSAEGFEVKKSYATYKKVEDNKAREVYANLELKTVYGTPIDTHTIRAVVNYEAVDASGNVSRLQQPFEVPIEVLPMKEMPGWQVALLVPPTIVFMLVSMPFWWAFMPDC